MPEQFKSLRPTPEQEIEKRLANAMHHLKLEMASQGVDVDAVSCSYIVTWSKGEVSVLTPSDEPVKVKSKTKVSDSAAEN